MGGECKPRIKWLKLNYDENSVLRVYIQIKLLIEDKLIIWSDKGSYINHNEFSTSILQSFELLKPIVNFHFLLPLVYKRKGVILNIVAWKLSFCQSLCGMWEHLYGKYCILWQHQIICTNNGALLQEIIRTNFEVGASNCHSSCRTLISHACWTDICLLNPLLGPH